VDKTGTTVFDLVAAAYQSPLYIVLYIVAVIIAGVHVSHGFWSAFQTIGANHPKYMPLIKGVSLVLAFAVAIGFGSLPIYISLTV
jgi:succinate dehydrogenase / fumarate reductase cytochrome b subunit